MAGEMRFDVFLSYNSSDKPTVRRLEKALKNRLMRRSCAIAVWTGQRVNHAAPYRVKQ